MVDTEVTNPRQSVMHRDSQSGSGQTVVVNAELWLCPLWEGVLSNQELWGTRKGEELGFRLEPAWPGRQSDCCASQLDDVTQVLTFWKEQYEG